MFYVVTNVFLCCFVVYASVSACIAAIVVNADLHIIAIIYRCIAGLRENVQFVRLHRQLAVKGILFSGCLCVRASVITYLQTRRSIYGNFTRQRAARRHLAANYRERIFNAK